MSNLISDLYNKITGLNKPKKIFCYAPFLQVFIDSESNVFPCPDCFATDFEAIKIGNLKQNSFNKIWNSSSAKKIRKRIINKDSSNCVLHGCASKTNFYMNVLQKYLLSNKEQSLNTYPKIVIFGQDIKVLNQCIMAKYDVPEIDENLKDKYFDALKEADQVIFSHGTDPFSNKKTSNFIKEVAEKFPKVKFNLISNGILFDKDHCDDLGITERLSNVLILISAANKETYDEYFKNGEFENLKQNLNWLKSLKQQGKLSGFFIGFVIDEHNFKEMPAFVDLAKEYDAKAIFWLKNNYKYDKEGMLSSKYITNIANEHYAEFVDVLNSYNFNNEYSSLPFVLNNLIDKY